MALSAELVGESGATVSTNVGLPSMMKQAQTISPDGANTDGTVGKVTKDYINHLLSLKVDSADIVPRMHDLCTPLCMSTCPGKHHPLLVSMLNCADTNEEEKMASRLQHLKKTVDKYSQVQCVSSHGILYKWCLWHAIPDKTDLGYGQVCSWTLGHWAAALGNVRALQWLIMQGFQMMSTLSEDKNMPLHTALIYLPRCRPLPIAISKLREMVPLMSSAIRSHNHRGYLPIHLVCSVLRDNAYKDFYIAALDLIINCGDCVKKSKHMRVFCTPWTDNLNTPLHLLALNDAPVEAFHTLICDKFTKQLHLNLFNVKNSKNMTPLGIACLRNNLPVIQYFEQYAKQNMPQPNKKVEAGESVKPSCSQHEGAGRKRKMSDPTVVEEKRRKSTDVGRQNDQRSSTNDELEAFLHQRAITNKAPAQVNNGPANQNLYIPVSLLNQIQLCGEPLSKHPSPSGCVDYRTSISSKDEYLISDKEVMRSETPQIDSWGKSSKQKENCKQTLGELNVPVFSQYRSHVTEQKTLLQEACHQNQLQPCYQSSTPFGTVHQGNIGASTSGVLANGLVIDGVPSMSLTLPLPSGCRVVPLIYSSSSSASPAHASSQIATPTVGNTLIFHGETNSPKYVTSISDGQNECMKNLIRADDSKPKVAQVSTTTTSHCGFNIYKDQQKVTTVPNPNFESSVDASICSRLYSSSSLIATESRQGVSLALPMHHSKCDALPVVGCVPPVKSYSPQLPETIHASRLPCTISTDTTVKRDRNSLSELLQTIHAPVPSKPSPPTSDVNIVNQSLIRTAHLPVSTSMQQHPLDKTKLAVILPETIPILPCTSAIVSMTEAKCGNMSVTASNSSVNDQQRLYSGQSNCTNITEFASYQGLPQLHGIESSGANNLPLDMHQEAALIKSVSNNTAKLSVDSPPHAPSSSFHPTSELEMGIKKHPVTMASAITRPILSTCVKPNNIETHVVDKASTLITPCSSSDVDVEEKTDVESCRVVASTDVLIHNMVAPLPNVEPNSTQLAKTVSEANIAKTVSEANIAKTFSEANIAKTVSGANIAKTASEANIAKTVSSSVRHPGSSLPVSLFASANHLSVPPANVSAPLWPIAEEITTGSLQQTPSKREGNECVDRENNNVKMIPNSTDKSVQSPLVAPSTGQPVLLQLPAGLLYQTFAPHSGATTTQVVNPHENASTPGTGNIEPGYTFLMPTSTFTQGKPTEQNLILLKRGPSPPSAPNEQVYIVSHPKDCRIVKVDGSAGIQPGGTSRSSAIQNRESKEDLCDTEENRLETHISSAKLGECKELMVEEFEILREKIRKADRWALSYTAQVNKMERRLEKQAECLKQLLHQLYSLQCTEYRIAYNQHQGKAYKDLQESLKARLEMCDEAISALPDDEDDDITTDSPAHTTLSCTSAYSNLEKTDMTFKFGCNTQGLNPRIESTPAHLELERTSSCKSDNKKIQNSSNLSVYGEEKSVNRIRMTGKIQHAANSISHENKHSHRGPSTQVLSSRLSQEWTPRQGLASLQDISNLRDIHDRPGKTKAKTMFSTVLPGQVSSALPPGGVIFASAASSETMATSSASSKVELLHCDVTHLFDPSVN